MRKFKPLTWADFAKTDKGERFEVYFKYLAEYINEYFAELAKEQKKKNREVKRWTN